MVIRHVVELVVSVRTRLHPRRRRSTSRSKWPTASTGPRISAVGTEAMGAVVTQAMGTADIGARFSIRTPSAIPTALGIGPIDSVPTGDLTPAGLTVARPTWVRYRTLEFHPTPRRWQGLQSAATLAAASTTTATIIG